MPKTLLLADDSVVIQKLVGLSFANEDVEIVTADNGDDAISLAEQTKPDIVIADVIMPGKSGYEVCEAIKQSGELAHIPVLLLTGTFEAFDEERASTVGSAGHITKPFEAQALVQRVTALLETAARPAAAKAPAAAAATPDLEITEEAPAPSSPNTADEAFDFFDDDVSDLSKVEDVAAPAKSAPDPLADPFTGAANAAFSKSAAGESAEGIADLDAGLLGNDSTVALMPDDGDSAHELPTDLVDLDAALDAEASAQPDPRPTTLVTDAAEGSSWPDEGIPSNPAETVLADFGDEFATPVAPAAKAQASAPAPATKPPARTNGFDAEEPESMSAMDVSDEFEFGSGAPPAVEDPAQTRLADELFNEPASAPSPVNLDLEIGAQEADELALDPNEDLLSVGGDAEADVSMDPGDSSFDISASDLGDLDLESGDAEDDEEEPLAFAEPVEEADAFDLPPAIETLESEPIADGPNASSYDDLLGASAVQPVGSADAFAAADTMPPVPAPAIDLTPPPIPAVEMPPVPAPAEVAPAASAERAPADEVVAPVFAPDVPEVAPAEPELAAPAASVDMSPMLQERLHETLEKVAWEAFSEISEQVVKQVLARVEAIAWEVIPQMAESLVREEIRKMKGEDESSE